MHLTADFYSDDRSLDTKLGYLLFGEQEERPASFEYKDWELSGPRLVVSNKEGRQFYYVFYGEFAVPDDLKWSSVTGNVDSFLELDYLGNQKGYDRILFNDVNRDIQEVLSTDWAVLLRESDTLEGGGQDDRLLGYAGDDILIGGGGQDYIVGGEGLDIAVYQGNLTDYRIDQGVDYASAYSDWPVAGDDAPLTVWDRQSGRDGIDFLEGVERLYFNDFVIAFDFEGIPGQAFRLYQAAFDREPDAGGMGFWIAQLEDGMTLREATAHFIASPEFFTLYGRYPSNGEFITALYNNVLDREPEPEGYGWWTDQMNNDPAFTWDVVMLGFSESPENQAKVLDLIADGITYVEWVL